MYLCRSSVSHTRALTLPPTPLPHSTAALSAALHWTSCSCAFFVDFDFPFSFTNLLSTTCHINTLSFSKYSSLDRSDVFRTTTIACPSACKQMRPASSRLFLPDSDCDFKLHHHSVPATGSSRTVADYYIRRLMSSLVLRKQVGGRNVHRVVVAHVVVAHAGVPLANGLHFTTAARRRCSRPRRHTCPFCPSRC